MWHGARARAFGECRAGQGQPAGPPRRWAKPQKGDAHEPTEETRTMVPLGSLLSGLFLLFSAYLCRPTTALFACVVFLYMLLKKRSPFVKSLITYLICFGLFVLFSWIEYKQVLPDYYLPQQLGPPGEFWWAIYGHFLSPSRGILIQSSYLIIPLIGAIYGCKHLSRNRYF